MRTKRSSLVTLCTMTLMLMGTWGVYQLWWTISGILKSLGPSLVGNIIYFVIGIFHITFFAISFFIFLLRNWARITVIVLALFSILVRIIAFIYLLNMKLYFQMNEKDFLASAYYIAVWTSLYIVLIFIFSHNQIKEEFK
jgi:hypothetical protein